jgi:hypothetical protein
LLRTSRLAVVNESVFELELGTLSPQRLREVKERLAHFLYSSIEAVSGGGASRRHFQ